MLDLQDFDKGIEKKMRKIKPMVRKSSKGKTGQRTRQRRNQRRKIMILRC